MNVLGFYWLLEMLQDVQRLSDRGVHVLPPRRLRVPRAAHRRSWDGSTGAQTARGWPALPVVLRERSWRASSRYPLLFPWYFAATVHKVPALTQVAELGGPILVGLVLARGEPRARSSRSSRGASRGVPVDLSASARARSRWRPRWCSASCASRGRCAGRSGRCGEGRHGAGQHGASPEARRSGARGYGGTCKKTARAEESRAPTSSCGASRRSRARCARRRYAPQMLQKNVASRLELPAIFGGGPLQPDTTSASVWYNIAVSSDEPAR